MRKSITPRISALLSASILVILACPAFVRAGVITDLGTTTPTPGAADQYYLVTAGLTGSSFYDNESSNSGPLAYGETFTTGDNADGYTLNYVILQINHNYSNGGGNLAIPFTIEDSTHTTPVAATESVTGITGNPLLQSDGGFDGHYIEYTFDTPISLAANTQYSLVMGQFNQGAVNFKGTTSDGYAGGAAFTNDNGDPLNIADLVFDAGMTVAVPEPGTWVMMLGGFGMLVVFRRRCRHQPA